MCQVMRAACKERLQERQACIEARLAEGWPVEVTEGLSAADMAVPRDLIDTPPVRPPLFGGCRGLCSLAHVSGALGMKHVVAQFGLTLT
jgi:hypothetical protein